MLPRLQAQSDTGNIVGTVTDATGAVIPDAPVTATNTETGQKLTAVSNGAGEFNILAVPRGSYSVAVKVKGFQAQSSAVTVVVMGTQNVIFKLSPSNVSTTLEVTTEAPLINVSDSFTARYVCAAPLIREPRVESITAASVVNGAQITTSALSSPLIFGSSSKTKSSAPSALGTTAFSKRFARAMAKSKGGGFFRTKRRAFRRAIAMFSHPAKPLRISPRCVP